MRYHFIGIKGSGMSALAKLLADRKEQVQGSDIDKYIFTQKELEERNIPILSFSADNIKEDYIVIIGNAFDEDHIEVKKAREMKNICYRYHEFLGKLMNEYCSIAVAGTHGKTTTTGLLAHLMRQKGNCGYLIGDGSGYMPENAKYFAVESCEYQRHFLAYHPDYAIITNIELDHVDYFTSLEDYLLAFQTFASQVKKTLVLFGDDSNIRKLKLQGETLYYGEKEENDVVAKNINSNESGMEFDVIFRKKTIGRFKIPFTGNTFLWNALAVISIGLLEEMPIEDIKKAMETFPGVKRRFVEEKVQKYVLIDDYAHHPTAIFQTIQSAKMRYPDKQVVAIFKPDRYSRIAYFLKEFAESLALADFAYVCEFPSNAVKEKGIEISSIKEICNYNKNIVFLEENEAGAKQLLEHKDVVFLFMSSKDIYKFKDLIKSLIQKR